ncbi:MAG: glycosyl hydrolase 108 family protein [Desulfuromonadaceae bacterium]|nr:glycosyl hydrolase 108 family protein [Desulfuromonadaceae bacterium]MDD2856787.1 glycosyl hydrolase 108 family protein [Desulfuromonadaceae bacterium]
MAEFEPAYKAMVKHEGGYANDPHDHGGETCRAFFLRKTIHFVVGLAVRHKRLWLSLKPNETAGLM